MSQEQVINPPKHPTNTFYWLAFPESGRRIFFFSGPKTFLETPYDPLIPMKYPDPKQFLDYPESL